MRRVAVLRAGLVAVCLALAVAGCGGHGRRAAVAARTVVPPHLLGRHRCHDAPGFTCATLIVPVDHAAGDASGTLRLPVGVQDVAAAPHGDLLFLTGGPGQGGVDFLTRVSTRLRPALAGYRLVMFDQRGTGATALQCPALQAAAGASDLAIVAHGTVAACARALGPRRRFYTTSETVADIDELRAVLGARRLTLDGVSYGTFVAERYALAYPRQVARLVLDSVVPHAGVDPLYLASIQAVARVLRAVCAAQRCGSDPVADLAAVVASDRNGPEVLNALVGDSVGNPEFTGVPAAIHAARLGHPAALRGFLAAVDRGEAAPAGELSQGLHESTLCLDLAAPWDAGAPMAARAAALARDAAALPERAFYPFDRATAVGNGIAQGCLEWPPTTAPSSVPVDASARLPPVPVLLLAGGRDLSTPLAWARSEHAKAPDSALVVVPSSGHSVQLRAVNPAARQILRTFLHS